MDLGAKNAAEQTEEENPDDDSPCVGRSRINIVPRLPNCALQEKIHGNIN